MAHIILEKRVAAVDQDIAGFQQAGQLDDRVVGDLARREHDPDRARLLQLVHEIGKVAARRGSLTGQTAHRLGAFVVDDAAMAGSHQPPHDVAAHPAKADHTELH